MKQIWIVIDIRTKKALFGLGGKSLLFNSQEEADNFGKQICNEFISVQITI